MASSFESFPGLPVFHSRDLVNRWRLGSAFDRPFQTPPRRIRALTRRVHADDPAEPWSEPHWLDHRLDGEGLAPSLFFADANTFPANDG